MERTAEQQHLIEYLRSQEEYDYVQYLSFLISSNNKAVWLVSESVYASLHKAVHDQNKLITSVVDAFTMDTKNSNNIETGT